MEFSSRTNLLLTPIQKNSIENAKVCVFGVGGVGGYVCELLVRCGIKRLTIVDFDIVEISNLNRQIIATTKTIGLQKVEAMKNRIEEINPNCQVEPINFAYNEQNKNSFNLKEFDYVVDAIDSVPDKVLLIKECQKEGVKIISAMGAGNKIETPSFQICDIYKTQNDGLAKKMRKLLKEAGVKKLDVCFSGANSLPNKTIGSIAYYPACAGSVIAGYVINQIIKGD